MWLSFYEGKLPETYKDIISIKGIGEYIAAAILFIAHYKVHAVVDDNVYRVLSRLFADSSVDTTSGEWIFSRASR